MDKRTQSIKMKAGALSAIQTASSLEDKQEIAISFINKKAGSVRAQYITVTPGQDAVYLAKVDEATAYQEAVASSQTIQEGDYPHLSSEVGITANDLNGVVSIILTKRNEWLSASAVIESLRLNAIKSIDAATSEDQIFTALKINWPKPV